MAKKSRYLEKSLEELESKTSKRTSSFPEVT